MLALSKVLDMKIHQLDVHSEFFHANLKEDMFVKPPPGMDLRHEAAQESVWIEASAAKLEQEHCSSYQIN